MKIYTGIELTNASPYVQLIKHKYENRMGLFTELLNGLVIRKCVVDKKEATLTFSGKKHDMPFSLDIVVSKPTSRADGRILKYVATYDGTDHTMVANEGSYVNSPTNHDDLLYARVTEYVVDELLLWIDAVPNNFTNCKLSMYEWKRHNPDQYELFSSFVLNHLSVDLQCLDYKPEINHFAKCFRGPSISFYLGYSDKQRPFFLATIYSGCVTDDTLSSDKLFQLASQGYEVAENYSVIYTYHQGVVLYSIDEALGFIETVQSRIDGVLDSIAKHHDFNWRGLEYNEDGPIGVDSVEDARREYKEKVIDLLENYIGDHLYDYRSVFPKETRTEVSDIKYGDVHIKYAKQFKTVKKQRDTTKPVVLKYGITADIHTRNLTNAYNYNEDLDVYRYSVELCLPLMYRNIEGEFYSFDEACENNTMGGPIDVVYKKRYVSIQYLCDERDRQYRDHNIDEDIMRVLFFGTPEDKEAIKSKYHDYLHRNTSYLDKLLGEYEAQYNKYLEYVKTL